MTFKLVLRGKKRKIKDLRPKVYLLDRVYLPKSAVQMQLAKKHYDRRVYYQKGCNRCPVFKEGNRFCDVCAGCDNFKGRYVTFEVVEIGNIEYVAFPAGSVDSVFKNLGLAKINFNVQDNRCDKRVKYPLKFTGKLYDGTQIVNGYAVANQKQIVRDFSKYKRGLIESPPRSGKCLTKNSLICSDKGFTYLNDVTTKSNIATGFGSGSVSAVYKKYSKTYKITTKNGYEVEGTPEHPVLVLTENFEYKWKQLRNLQKEEIIVLSKDSLWSSKNFIEHIEAELLGYIIANGYMYHVYEKGGHINISTNNKEIQNRILSILEIKGYSFKIHKKSKKRAWSITSSDLKLRLELKKLGLEQALSSKKSIPSSVLKSSKEIITTFLSAYFSCDSYIPVNNDIELCTASSKLANELRTILLAYGIITNTSKIWNYARNGNNKKIKLYYRLNISSVCHKNFLDIFNIRKKHSNKVNCDESKYLLNAIPYVSKTIINIASKYRKPNGYIYLVNEKKVKFSLDKAGFSQGSKRNNGRITRTKLSKAIENLKVFKEVEAVKFNNLVFAATNDQLVYDNITSIKKSPIAKPVYDITIPKQHSFVANGIVCHNTVIATAIYCGAKRTTLYMAHEKQLLLQFYRTILKFTNLRQLRKETGKKIVGIIEKESDWLEDWDLVLVNNHKFISKKGVERIRKHAIKRFGQLICDECLPDGSLLLTSEGVKPIQDITINDEVLSYNHLNKTLEFKKVIHTWNNIKPKPMVCVKHEHGVLECSEDHLLWCVNKNDYIKAIDLTNKDIILFDNSF